MDEFRAEILDQLVREHSGLIHSPDEFRQFLDALMASGQPKFDPGHLGPFIKSLPFPVKPAIVRSELREVFWFVAGFDAIAFGLPASECP